MSKTRLIKLVSCRFARSYQIPYERGVSPRGENAMRRPDYADATPEDLARALMPPRNAPWTTARSRRSGRGTSASSQQDRQTAPSSPQGSRSRARYDTRSVRLTGPVKCFACHDLPSALEAESGSLVKSD